MITASEADRKTDVVELFYQQRHNGSPEGDYRLGIAPDGGGAASVFALGAMEFLDDEGFIENAEVIGGVSGGAIVSIAALSGLYTEAKDLFGSLGKEGVIAPSRLIMPNKGPALCLDTLEDRIKSIGLNVGRIVGHSANLVIGVSELSEFNNRLIESEDLQTEKDILMWLKRTSHFPILAGPPEKDASYIWGDGGMSWISSADVVRSAGATRVLEINNHYRGNFDGSTDKRNIKQWNDNRLFRNMVELWLRKHVGVKAAVNYRNFLYEQRQFMNGRNEPDVSFMQPPENSKNMPGMITTSKEKIENGYKAGRQAARLALGYEVEDLGRITEYKQRRRYYEGADKPLTLVPTSP